MKRWHLLTPEYPPACGGVGDYTALVAAALAEAGDEVHVWYPAPPGTAVRNAPRLTVHPLPIGLRGAAGRSSPPPCRPRPG